MARELLPRVVGELIQLLGATARRPGVAAQHQSVTLQRRQVLADRRARDCQVLSQLVNAHAAPMVQQCVEQVLLCSAQSFQHGVPSRDIRTCPGIA
ncbi:hypothetical protein D3C76_1060920 [compost metagenome]